MTKTKFKCFKIGKNCTKYFKDDVSTGEVKEASGNIYILNMPDCFLLIEYVNILCKLEDDHFFNT